MYPINDNAPIDRWRHCLQLALRLLGFTQSDLRACLANLGSSMREPGEAFLWRVGQALQKGPQEAQAQSLDGAAQALMQVLVSGPENIERRLALTATQQLCRIWQRWCQGGGMEHGAA